MSRREALEQALARALDSGGGRALASAIPARAELAIVVDHDAVELADALEPLLRALERQGIARTHLELVLACDAGGAPVPRERCDALRARHPGVRVHASDPELGEGWTLARDRGGAIELDDALRECEGLIVLARERAGIGLERLLGDVLLGVATQATRAGFVASAEALARALPVDYLVLIDERIPPTLWTGPPGDLPRAR